MVIPLLPGVTVAEIGLLVDIAALLRPFLRTEGQTEKDRGKNTCTIQPQNCPTSYFHVLSFSLLY